VKKFVALGAAIAAFGFVSSASAADMAYKAPMAPPVVSWAGFYVGVNLGGGFGTTGASETGLPTALVTASADYGLNHSLTGWLGGALIGYNYQTGQWVWGIEADFDAGNINGSGMQSGVGVAQRNGVNAFAGNFVTAGEKIDFFSTLRGRVGMLTDPNLLIYATGGLAVAHVKYNGQFHYATPVDYIVSDSATRFGWTIGAGLEYRVAALWTVRGEYLYYDLGSHSVVSDFGIPTSPPFQSQFDFKTHGSIVRAALTYKLGGP
jgi:outer membrane immunogenic protein